MKSDKTTKKLIFAGLFAALCCVATMVIRIPTPLGGYINAGDALVLLAGFLLGPLWGALAAGTGTALADLVLGYAMFVPGTFVIKFTAALVAGAILKSAIPKKPTVKAVIGGIAAEIIIIAGYFAYEFFALSFGLAAAANIPLNVVQAVFGIAAGAALFAALSKTNYFREL